MKKSWILVDIIGSYLRNGRGKDNNFIEFSNPLHELIHTGAFYDIDVVIRSFDFDGYGKVRLLKQLL